MKKFAVVGNPVNHSLSPVIHQQFARQFDIQLEYTKIQVEAGEFQNVVNTFRHQGGAGLNVTVPYKTDAYAISQQLSTSATLAKAVNTLIFNAESIKGDNTDGTGLVNDLIHNHGFNITNKSILILGAGGAVSGVLGPLLIQQPQVIVIANRTVAKAIDLQQNFSHLGSIIGCGLDQIKSLKFDLIINGTAASLAGQTPSIDIDLLKDVQFAYDMMYASEATVFMRWAQANGVEWVADGLGMLVEQAAAAFEIWHGVKPDTRQVLIKLRA